MRVGRWLERATLVSLMATGGLAQSTTFSLEEEQAVAVCLSLIRGCQLPDGAFAQVSPVGTTHAPIWIAPYFANYAALALLAEFDRNKSPEDLTRVGRWLAWCADNQTAEGFWTDHTGTLEAYKRNGTVDAWDSSAALFLMVAGRYRRAGGSTTSEILTAAKRALACIEHVTDSDGLTWAKPDYKIKFLMDNVEVCAGLRAVTGLLSASEVDSASEHADRIAKKLPVFWNPAKGFFAYALLPDNSFSGGLDKPYPHVLAQLFGFAFVEPHAAAWETLVKTFQPETGQTTSTGPEWWLVTASRIGDDLARSWREKVVHEVTSFSSQRVYLQRPALTVLALLDGADWMPINVLHSEKARP